MLTCLFYLCVVAAVVSPIFFVRGIWNEAQNSDYRWISDSSRDMYADVLKTAISVAGVAVALVASSLHDVSDPAVKWSAHRSIYPDRLHRRLFNCDAGAGARIGTSAVS